MVFNKLRAQSLSKDILLYFTRVVAVECLLIAIHRYNKNGAVHGE